MALSTLAETIERSGCRLTSSDLFDTVLLRDSTTETERFALAARRAARPLGVDPAALARLRWTCHDNAYRAVALERPHGEATLTAICRVMAAALGRGEDAARLLHDAEVETDCEHLRPNRPLLRLLEGAARSGTRVVAVSDTYYSGEDLERILAAVVGDHPFAAIYSSADIGLSKHHGGLYGFVAEREGVLPAQILHIGDNPRVDVEQATAASWGTVHLARNGAHRAVRLVGKARSAPLRIRRGR